MNTNKFCPSCGDPITPEMKTCPNCGENLVDEVSIQTKNNALKKAQSTLEDNEPSKDGLQIGSRSNVVGDVMGRKIETQSMTENTNTHVEANTNTTNSISTSNVDNSQKVVNSNTNNVTYNIIYQNTGQIGAQIPNQTPGIPDFNPVLPKAQQNDQEQKGIGSIAGNQVRKPITDEDNKGKLKTIIAVCVGMAVVIGLFFVLDLPEKTPHSPMDNTSQKQVEQVVEKNVTENPTPRQVSSYSETTPEVRNDPEPASMKQAAPKKETETDTNYENGMKAYQSQEGIEAIKYFKKSGSAESNYMLGLIYEQGCGNIAANAMMARKYFKTAAEMGSESAKAKL